MKVVKWVAAGITGIALAGQASAQGVLDCEFKAIVPENADFFTSGFRPAPRVGTRVQIDFDSEQITSMVFADGQIFFGPGDGTLTKLKNGFSIDHGYGGVRIGNQGTYIALLDPATPIDDSGTVFTSRLAVTKAYRDESFHLVTHATHYGDLECKPVAQAR